MTRRRRRTDWATVALFLGALLFAALLGYAFGLEGGLRELFMGGR